MNSQPIRVGFEHPLRCRHVRPGCCNSCLCVLSGVQPRKLLRLEGEPLPSRQRAWDTVAADLGKLDAPGILGLHFPDVSAPPAIEFAISRTPAAELDRASPGRDGEMNPLPKRVGLSSSRTGQPQWRTLTPPLGAATTSALA
jgi:hypothetical protein